MKNLTLFCLIFATGFTFKAHGQFEVFTDSIKGLRNGSVTFTDFNSDGDIDILSFGDDTLANVYSLLYLNDNLKFTESKVENLPALQDGSVDWADFNNDGKMDLAFIGWSPDSGTVISKILTYDSVFQFTDIELPGVSRGSIDWGDYNNDGRIDLLIVGQDINSNSIIKLFENQDSVFIEVNLGNIEGVSFGDATWVDYNNDGFLDFIVSGVTGVAPDTGSPVTRLYKNTGETFELVFDSLFEEVYESSIDWGDADNDGDLDLLITGFTSNYEPFTGIYINNDSTFNLIETSLPNVIEGFAKWGDYDNDGDLDILISGNSVHFNDKICKVYANDSLTFEQVFEGEGVGQSSGGWADFNNDGYLDFFINGQKEDFGMLAAVYLNTLPEQPNERILNSKNPTKIIDNPPSIPSGLSHEISGNQVKLIWDSSLDDNTPSNSLTYSINLYKDGEIVISALSNSSGIRSLVEPGNAGTRTFYLTDELPNGTYSWSVQSIDNTFLASPFSVSETFSIEDEEIIQNVSKELTSGLILYPNPVADKIYLNTSGKEFFYQVFDMNGAILQQGLSENSYIEVNNLRNGMYLLKVQVDKEIYFKRVIKK